MNRRDFLRSAVQGLAGLAGLAVANNSTATVEQVEADEALDVGRLSQDVDENGGYLVPPEFQAQILQMRTKMSENMAMVEDAAILSGADVSPVPPDIESLHLLEDLEFLTGAGDSQPLGVINNGVVLTGALASDIVLDVDDWGIFLKGGDHKI